MHILNGYDNTQLEGYSNFSVLEQGAINLLVVWSWQLGFNLEVMVLILYKSLQSLTFLMCLFYYP